MSRIGPAGRRRTALRTYSRRNLGGPVAKPAAIAARRKLPENSKEVTQSPPLSRERPVEKPAAITRQPPTQRSIGPARSTAAEARSRSSRTKTQTNAVETDTVGVSQSTDFRKDDEIVGWKFNRATKSVDLITYRASDDSKRLVPESVVQQKVAQKVYAYWESFNQPREVTVGSDYFHIFAIIDQKNSKLKVQWVGYTDSADDTTWETKAKVRKMNPTLLTDYLARRERAAGTQTTSKLRRGRMSGAAIG
ncbi:uncharacterized protein LY79DRAFT_344517 [Colletotrichum navitas]|uniref:Chromo domain-containing protein n=1 Tax=Colletotrichum navitas TaxID=681940 RepID=A0AAD8PRL0_9PEZI|nr:uncharacterized protein LY79DRAFT_344517 [Colletotrichum navitas]KAK1579371.1 hypothetical protein LY79DRAFT_344517 [Colletotrichum navitas]